MDQKNLLTQALGLIQTQRRHRWWLRGRDRHGGGGGFCDHVPADFTSDYDGEQHL